ncbi:threonine/homoserine/homoserine lactone efflux protein [Diaminobutyricimonas aerilata]|uniref:Threonine/homoserine/homoserine lactone efflux protein n=1 Tax=Diaminobutyricimonas aerilata TaxID=1162967 RepID=A0A2M9CH82_9MICO|nr:LysE family translocator [Diaminobutyricimonas aerilata]PJJ71281.1 threonine/homoserine/homoserine lactone efflux protein [Diaminobutyricimonas aerilata]
MPPWENVIAFTLAAAVLIAIPGPSVLFVIGRALVLGRRGALLSVLGNTVGISLQIVAVAAGLGTLLEQSIVLYTVVKYVGAAFLVYLGVQAIRHRRRIGAADTTAVPTRRIAVLRQSVFVGVSNPKSIVFFAAVFPQFTDAAAGPLPMQMLGLGAIFAVLALLMDGTTALLAGAARDWFARSPRRIRTLSATGGVAMIGLGAGLAVSESRA